MNLETKKQLKLKARKAYGLLDVLSWDIDVLRDNIDSDDKPKVIETIYDIEDTIQKITTTIDEIRFILKQDNVEGS